MKISKKKKKENNMLHMMSMSMYDMEVSTKKKVCDFDMRYYCMKKDIVQKLNVLARTK